MSLPSGWAHPRVRGDVCSPNGSRPRSRGSPPRARGRPPKACPAHTLSRAHPRVRGDVEPGEMIGVDVVGSPPRARGRLQPAKTTTPGSAAHPRVRGDVPLRRRPRRRSLGSPPRARGRPHRMRASRAPNGLTPACAGTSTRAAPTLCWSRAHPRVRGDVVPDEDIKRLVAGSPPRARGRRGSWRGDAVLLGLTPACAGTSLPRPGWLTGRWAHPRVRGDVEKESRMKAEQRGSPPRARGRPPRPMWLRVHGGLTPACAGTSRPGRPGTVWPRAHPRVRGDVPGGSGGRAVCGGSPPRARGRRPNEPGSPR